MSGISRRSFLGGVAALPFSVWFERYAAAAPAPLTRYAVTSTQGKAMLTKYKGAVKTMVSKPESDPIGWLFQWYTHGVRSDRTKAAEITRVYPAASPTKMLAGEVWDTCQAHHLGDVEDYFLPWHRMYVYFLERIVRKVSGDAAFTLPYWNYSSTTSVSGPRLPSKFRTPASATNALFRTNRNPGPKAGQPIDLADPGALNLDALKEASYSPVGVAPGFNMALDSGLHGNVHVLVGNTLGMGRVPWAANDPIFWLHHCNIDRLWASWNHAGRANPTDSAWLTHQFVFADENGNRVETTIQDFLSIDALGYTYDRFEPVPPSPAPAPAAPTAARQPLRLARVARGPVALGQGPVRVTLEPPAGAAAGVPLTARVRDLGAQKRLYLVLKDLRAQAQPGVLYHVYLDLPPGTSPRHASAHHVGVVSFFDAVGHGGHSDHAPSTGTQKFLSFDITPIAKNLQAKRRLRAKPTVTIVPFNKPYAAAKPVIGEITLVEQ